MIKSILITRITRIYNNNRLERKIMFNNHNMETSSIMLNNNNKECIIIKWTTIINNSNIILSLNKIITVKTIIITIKTKIIIIIPIIRKWCNNKWECKQKKWQLISYYQTWYLIVKTNKEVGQYNRPSRMQLIKKKNRCLKLFISNLYN